MMKLIRGQRAKINGLYDDALSLSIIESDELNKVLEKLLSHQTFLILMLSRLRPMRKRQPLKVAYFLYF